MSKTTHPFFSEVIRLSLVNLKFVALSSQMLESNPTTERLKDMMHLTSIFFLLGLTSPVFAAIQTRNFNFQGIKIVVTDQTADKPEEGSAVTSKVVTFKGKKKIDSIEIRSTDLSAPLAEYNSNFLKGFFALAKTGDYDSRFVLVAKTGKILNVADGDTYRDSAYLYFLRVDRGGPEQTDRSRVNMKTFKVETYSSNFPPNIRKAKAWKRPENKWIPAEDYPIIDDVLGKTIPIKEYIKLKNE